MRVGLPGVAEMAARSSAAWSNCRNEAARACTSRIMRFVAARSLPYWPGRLRLSALNESGTCGAHSSMSQTTVYINGHVLHRHAQEKYHGGHAWRTNRVASALCWAPSAAGADWTGLAPWHRESAAPTLESVCEAVPSGVLSTCWHVCSGPQSQNENHTARMEVVARREPPNVAAETSHGTRRLVR